MYVLVFAREHIGALLLGVHVPAPRLLVMSVLVVMWGSRLTYNFARKGGYDSWLAAEDYRCAAVGSYGASSIYYSACACVLLR